MLVDGAERSFLSDWKVGSSVGSRKMGSSSALLEDADGLDVVAERCELAILRDDPREWKLPADVGLKETTVYKGKNEGEDSVIAGSRVFDAETS